MDGANADSDHSMTWEDFFGSTTDLTPTLIGIYDSFLDPKNSGPAVSRFDLTAKDARNDPPLDPKPPDEKPKEDKAAMSTEISISPPKEPPKLIGGVKLPGFSSINKSSLYTLRTKNDSANDSDNQGANNESVVKSVLSSSDSTFLHSKSSIYKSHLKSFKNDKVSDIITTPTVYDLSPNVKRMISGATETSTGIRFQKKSTNVVRSSIRGHKSNIPLVGATSKISQSGVEILPSVEIYDQPYGVKTTTKQVENYKSISSNSPVKTVPVKPEFRLEAEHTTYDVPSNKQAIYDVPTHNNKTAFESLSLPYIDQSIELSITSNDREFDTKLASKDNSPDKPKPTSIKILTPETSPTKIPLANSGTNSLHRKDFVTKCDIPTTVVSCSSSYPDAIGSTGNLKLCSVPEKENRLQPPAVEVPRPLSMSSIASSSSTSSSGVQHKGGVNSAYLASIESLDDHSDADITSANGSNNFVNNAGVIKVLPEDRRGVPIPQFQTDELIGLSQLERVCAEIVQTENVYVEDLRQVVEGYQHVWRNESVFSEEELNDLFNNIEDIYTFNRSFCEELNSCSLEATSLAKCFVNNNTGFTVYTSYCTGYPRTMERLAVLASRPHSARVFRERQTALGHPLPLASYLLKPVQRILKYHLLLQNVVKLCAGSETESALLKMTSIAQYIDDMKRKHEHAVRVQEIQSLLYGWVGPDLTTYGELCAEGTFRVFGAKAMRHVFLFDKMILITKNREDGILAYKYHIMCNNMMLVESIAGAPLSFHVIPWDAPKSQITLQATSNRHKREWTLLLKRVILENYNAVIPSHARQLVMELGQNKTDDDILAEKSHNLITQASMRKQLSAPEYLEKRKLERERRKSFENGIRGRLKKNNRKLTVPVTQIEVTQVICDCSQLSEQRETDYTCDSCYVDLCSDCETDLNNKDKSVEEKCSCKDDNHLSPVKCPECDRSLHYIDAGSAEHLERKQSCCKCSDFKSSQESVGKEFTGLLNKNRGYHSSDNIVSYSEKVKSKEDLSDTNNSSLNNIRNIPKTCLKCAKIKENIVVSSSANTIRSRKSRHSELDKKADTLRSKSKDDPQRSKLTKIGTWRRKSEPGLQENVITVITKKTTENENEKSSEIQGNEKIEFECRNCGSNKISRKQRPRDASDKTGVEIKMYNSKNIPKKISKLKKNRAKTLRHGTDSTAKFYAELSTDVSTENILHISESTDSINVVDKDENKNTSNLISTTLSKDDDIDEETYKKLIEKTDSFKKNELEKVKYLNKQKVINEGSEVESECLSKPEISGSYEEPEEPLEQIISQLLMQNREFQKLLKKQQLRNTAQRRHQRLLKSHSNPEPITLNSEPTIIKPKYGRQTSENLDCRKDFEENKIDITLSPPNEEQESDEDHIYETLRIVPRKLDNNTNTQVESPTLPIKRIEKAPESDYVYLSFDQLNKIKECDDGIYDVPVKQTLKVENKDNKPSDYYVTIDKPLPRPDISNTLIENVYDNVLDVCRRQKEPTELAPGEYLPMSSEQNPNAPEIWLSRQKEHFNVSRDRKSGSLPRSFQIVTSTSEEQNLSTFRNKPSNNNKTYLNRDGKVLSIDRPFTIASDKSELSFEDVENYMSDGDILKFTKSQKQGENVEGSAQNISQSTLELEEEIDRCYKNNFEEITLDANKNESVSTASQSNLVISATSSCEVLTAEKIKDNNDVEIIHPEHKIYKPTSNMLSIKNVLNRFKYKKNANADQTEINANDPSSPDSINSDLKSPTNEKRSGLNPRSYSKNLLQRFRNIIGDEQPDDYNRIDKLNKNEDSTSKSPLKNKIKVVITSTDATLMATSMVYSQNNDFSTSVYNTTTLSESQNEKNNLDVLSHSCDNINNQKPETRPIYEKSVSMITNSSTASTPSPTKSSSNSYQSLNKLPIYMQGSKHLGARIAQPDYVDPTTLLKDIKSDVKNVNVLINKNAVRPDSLFSSNSSFVTSSSEGAYQDPVPKTVKPETVNEIHRDISGSITGLTSDENFYEKTFEKIEQLTDADMFRDSAVYSDQEEVEETKTHTFMKNSSLRNEILRVESIKRNSSFKKTDTVTSTSKVENKSSFQTRVTVTGSKLQVEKVNHKEQRSQFGNNNLRSKLAPPVPAKPKLASAHSINDKNIKPIVTNKSINLSKKTEELSSAESMNVRTIKRHASYKQTYTRSESTPVTVLKSTEPKQHSHKKELIDENKTDTVSKLKTETSNNLKSPNSNIHLKRLSFERASLDSATRKLKTNSDVATDLKRSSTEMPKSTSKTVLERRMEIESMARNVPNRPNRKTSQIAKPTSITNKMATFEKPTNDFIDKQDIASTSTQPSNIPVDINSVLDKRDNGDSESKESWVKQVVNKFQ